jgi:hypothetical protein
VITDLAFDLGEAIPPPSACWLSLSSPDSDSGSPYFLLDIQIFRPYPEVYQVTVSGVEIKESVLISSPGFLFVCLFVLMPWEC